jgi:hypothetical protein
MQKEILFVLIVMGTIYVIFNNFYSYIWNAGNEMVIIGLLFVLLLSYAMVYCTKFQTQTINLTILTIILLFIIHLGFVSCYNMRFNIL